MESREYDFALTRDPPSTSTSVIGNIRLQSLVPRSMGSRVERIPIDFISLGGTILSSDSLIP